MRFSGKDVQTGSVFNFTIDGSDGVKKYPIQIIGGLHSFDINVVM